MEMTNYKSALEESTASASNVFVPIGAKRKPGKDSGLEYHSEVSTDAHLYNKIFETNAFEPDQDAQNEFYTTVFDVMNKKEVGDARNVGTAVGTAAMTVLGCLTFGTAAIGGIVGFIFGGTVGRSIANKMQLVGSKKDQKMTQEDLYILKLKCLLEAGNIHKSKYGNNINKHRLLVEKTLTESRIALERSAFKDKKTVDKLLGQYRNYVLDNRVHKAVLLSYKLLKQSMIRSDMNVLVNQKNASRRINEILLPYVGLIELNQDALNNKTAQKKNYVAYYKIKAFLTKDSIKDLSTSFSEHRVTPEALENLKKFLSQEVQSKDSENQKKAEKYVTNNLTESEVKKPLADGFSRLSSTMNPNVSTVAMRRKTNADGESPATFRNGVNEEFAEGEEHAHAANIFDIKSKNTLDEPHSQLKPFSAALASEQVVSSGQASPDMTRKAGAEAEEEKEPTPKPLIKLLSTFGSTPSNSKTSKSGNRYSMAAPSSPTKSPMKSPGRASERAGSKSPLAKLFSRRKSHKDTKTPRESIPANILALDQAATEKQADQDQDVVALDEGEELLKKVTAVGNDQEIKWERVVNTATITIEKVKPENSPVVLLRCWAFIEGFSPDEIFEQIYNTEKRSKWETVTMGLKEIEKISDTQHYIYFYVKTPMGISERDFVQKRNYRKDYPENGTITMSFKSTTHPSAPPLKNKIRAETYFAGYIIRPSKKAANSTDLCILSQVDIKGNIPKTIVNMVAGKAPAEWVSKLIKACEKARQEKK